MFEEKLVKSRQESEIWIIQRKETQQVSLKIVGITFLCHDHQLRKVQVWLSLMELSNLYNEILLQLYANCYVIMVKVGQGKNPKGDNQFMWEL